jgi:GMP synthase (glutamine-hydrolysing)
MFKAEKFIDEKIASLRAELKGNAVIACSGGVDSTVAAAIVSNSWSIPNFFVTPTWYIAARK